MFRQEALKIQYNFIFRVRLKTQVDQSASQFHCDMHTEIKKNMQFNTQLKRLI